MTRPIRLMMIRSTYSYGGVERQMIGFAGRFDKSMLQPVVCTFSDDGGADNPLIRQASLHGLETAVVHSDSGYDPKGVGDLNRLIVEQEIDMLCPQDYRSRFYAVTASHIRKLPVVATVHGYTGHTAKVKMYESYDRLFMLRHVDRVICVSEAIRSRLGRWGVPKAKLYRVYNSIESSEDAEHASNNHQPDGPVVCSVGRLSVEKGHRYLLDAWKPVHEKFPSALLYLVGDGPEHERLESQAEALGVRESIRFTGFADDPMEYMRNCDVFVLPSLAEGLPVALLEACSAGKPAAASDVGGVGEIITSGESGLLVRPGKPAELAQALLHLLENPEKSRTMGIAARDVVRDKFCFEKNVPLLEQMYVTFARMSR